MSSDLVQLITGIATLLTAIAALLTILEMRRQRTEGYRPAIAIDDEVVVLHRTKQGEKSTVVILTTGKAPSDERKFRDIRLSLRNVGAGAALEVEARWEFDAIEFAALLARHDPAAARGLSVEADFVRFESDGGHLSWMAQRIQQQHLGTLPISPEPPGAVVILPFAYIMLASAYFNALLGGDLETAFDVRLPPLTLVVSFRDRGGAQLESRYRIELAVAYLSTGGVPVQGADGWITIGQATFTVRAA